MKVIIMGCGRIGSTLSTHLSINRQEVCLIDRDPDSRELLAASFAGRFLVGNGFNRAVLEQAGIATADAFVAVTASDSTNVVGARIAKEVYRVPQVIARIYDPRRAHFYHDLGIPTVSSVRWTVGKIDRMLRHRRLDPEVSFGDGETLLVRETLPIWYTDRPLRSLEVEGQIHVVAVTRSGHSFLPTNDSLAQPGDTVSFAVAAGSLGRLRSFLDKELGS